MTEADIEALSDLERRQVLGWIVKRLGKSKRAGRRIKAFAAMTIGETILRPASEDTSNVHYSKRRAREILNTPDAEWKTRLTNQGRRVTRIR